MIGSVYNSSTCQTVGRISHKGIVYYAAQMEASALASDNNFVGEWSYRVIRGNNV